MTAREIASRAAADAVATYGPVDGSTAFSMRTNYVLDELDETRRSLAAHALEILRDHGGRLDARSLADLVLPRVRQAILSGKA
jgi:hypothetical protein